MTTTASTISPEVPTDLWIGGVASAAADGRRFAVNNPANEELVCYVADASPEDGQRALDVAVSVQDSWAATAPRMRATVLRNAYGLLLERAEHFAQLMTLELGRAIGESRKEVAYGAEFFQWFAEEAVRINGRTTVAPGDGGTPLTVTKHPVGPTLAITPWNFPLAMGTRKIGPALAAGCTVIVKPAAETPLTMLLLAKTLSEAGVPDGVVSVLPTSNAGALTERLMSDDRLRKVTFTGSTQVGRHLLRSAAQSILRSSMELGGNAPFVVFDDADIDAAVEGAIIAKMRNGGQACTAANRFLVHEKVADSFTDAFSARVKALRVGLPGDSETDIGPLVNNRRVEEISALVEDAISSGARLRARSEIPSGKGFYYPPTILDHVPANATILREEIFGPVAVIRTFAAESEAIREANNTEYGLAAYVYTRDLARARRVAAALRVGMIGLNRGMVSDPAAPFGGVKASGLGREGGTEGIEEYLDVKYVAG